MGRFRPLLPGQTMSGLFPLGRPTPRLPRHGVSAEAMAVNPLFSLCGSIVSCPSVTGATAARGCRGTKAAIFGRQFFEHVAHPLWRLVLGCIALTHTHHASSTTHLFTPTHATPLRTRTHAHIPCTQMRWLSSCSQLVRDDSIQVFDGASEFIFSFRHLFR